MDGSDAHVYDERASEPQVVQGSRSQVPGSRNRLSLVIFSLGKLARNVGSANVGRGTGDLEPTGFLKLE